MRTEILQSIKGSTNNKKYHYKTSLLFFREEAMERIIGDFLKYISIKKSVTKSKPSPRFTSQLAINKTPLRNEKNKVVSKILQRTE